MGGDRADDGERDATPGTGAHADAGSEPAGSGAGYGAGGSAADDGLRVLVLNPESGSGDHAPRVRELAADHGFDVRETSEAGDARSFAAAAAGEGAGTVAAAGGDGTLNQVVRGLRDAGALPSVRFAVVPAGTGNDFAGHVGVEGIDHAFEVIESGRVRTIDLGVADDRPFLNSCLAGLTADASARTSAGMKERLGVVAYVVSTLRAVVGFEGKRLHVETGGHEETWEGEAVLVLVGNARRFPGEGGTQANVEDGLLEVTVVEEQPTLQLLEEAAAERLFGTDALATTRLLAPSASIRALEDGPVAYSLDGEIVEARELSVRTEAGALRLPVGDGYDPDPGPLPE